MRLDSDYQIRLGLIIVNIVTNIGREKIVVLLIGGNGIKLLILYTTFGHT